MPFTVEHRSVVLHDVQPCVVLSGEGCSAVVLPEWGARLYTWHAAGYDWLDVSQGLTGGGVRAGAPLLFPMPNRVTGGTYPFEGRTVTQRVDGQPRVIHGLVYDMPFDVVSVHADDQCAACTLRWTHTPASARFEAYPFPCALTVTWTLTRDGVSLHYDIKNTGDQAMPYGFAWHPFLTAPNRAAVTVTLDADTFYEAVECFPTGRRLRVQDHPALDLRGGRRLDTLDVDTVYTGITPQTPFYADFADRGLRLIFSQSEALTHAVVYSGKQDFFCMENQTCATDAANLAAAGDRETGLGVLPPGQTAGGDCAMRLCAGC